jgi:hypothetical protein
VTTCWAAFDDWLELHVELGVGDSNKPALDSLWGTATWGGTNSHWSGLEPTWNDVTGRMLDANIQRGRRSWLDRIGMSSTVLRADNADGWLTWNADQIGTQDVRPGRPVRVWARTLADGVHHDLWRGFIEGIDDAYEPAHRPAASIRAQDAIAQIAHVDLPEQTPVGAGERSDVRIGRILDAADWPPQWRVLEQGQVTMQATNMARSLADELGITADSEGGVAYAGTDGNLYFRNRDWLRLATYATNVQATIGPDGVCGTQHTVVRDAGDLRNDVQLARAGGTMQRYIDNDSIVLYRRRAYSRGDLICETDAQVQLLAQRLLSSRSKSTVRLTDVTVAVVDAASATFVASVDYGWRLIVDWSDGGEHWEREVHVMGVTHQIRPTGWSVTLAVDDVYAQPTEPWGVGRWGTAHWTEAQ